MLIGFIELVVFGWVRWVSFNYRQKFGCGYITKKNILITKSIVQININNPGLKKLPKNCLLIKQIFLWIW